ncbi:MAG: pseudouridine synthase [Geminicoccaceae bacterium]
MTAIRHLEVKEGEAGIRLDRWLKRRFPKLTQGHLQKLLRTGQLRVDGRRAEASSRLETGQTVRVPPLATDRDDGGRSKPPPPQRLSGADVAFIKSLVLTDDGTVVALNKPAGLATQGGSKTVRHVDRLLPALDLASERCRLVHRLDRDTAGLLILARGAEAAAHLTEAFRHQRVEKLYWAIVRGRVKEPRGLINMALEKQGGAGRERMKGSDAGKPAKTLFHVVGHAGRIATWLALRPLTGRTHQLRVHCAAIGHPILGDMKYGGDRPPLNAQPEGLMLFAREARLPHPKGFSMHLEAPLAAHLKSCFEWLGFEESGGREHDLQALAT